MEKGALEMKLLADIQKLVDKYCSQTGVIPEMVIGLNGYSVQFTGARMALHLRDMRVH